MERNDLTSPTQNVFILRAFLNIFRYVQNCTFTSTIQLEDMNIEGKSYKWTNYSLHTFGYRPIYTGNNSSMKGVVTTCFLAEWNRPLCLPNTALNLDMLSAAIYMLYSIKITFISPYIHANYILLLVNEYPNLNQLRPSAPISYGCSMPASLIFFYIHSNFFVQLGTHMVFSNLMNVISLCFKVQLTKVINQWTHALRKFQNSINKLS